MSEITRAAIGMPFEMAMENELSRRQFHSIAQALLAERDRLRAEVAGLRTGYEAYEQVNAELKSEVARSTEREILQLAEIEALRKALKPLLAHWDDLKPGESLNVDAARAALGQGEQS